jgi:hypothetical protein
MALDPLKVKSSVAVGAAAKEFLVKVAKAPKPKRLKKFFLFMIYRFASKYKRYSFNC